MANHHDVFLSYATADNTDLAKAWKDQSGWVMCFKVALQQALDRELGRQGSADWFLDAKSLRTGDHLSDSIRTALSQTKFFVAIASNGYFHDHAWCNKERQYFVQSLKGRGNWSRRILGVLLDEAVLDAWKEEVSPECRAFPFYKKDAATERCIRFGEGEIDSEFIQRISTLAKDIAEQVKATAGEEAVACVTPASKGRIFLAAVPGEIEEDRTELAAVLSSEGWQVVPDANTCQSDPAECQQEAAEIASRALAFVQLLSPHPWKPFPYDRTQFLAAKNADIPIYRYRSDTLADLTKVRDSDHRRWLGEHNVASRSIPQIEREVLLHLERNFREANTTTPPPVPDDASADSAFVTLSVAETEWNTVGKELAKRLERKSIYSVIQRGKTLPFEDCLRNEHGLVAVFGNEEYDRVEQVLMEWRRLLAKYRRRPETAPPSAVYLSEPPPGDKSSAINMTLPGLRILSWDDENGLNELAKAIRSYAGKCLQPTENNEAL